MPRIPAVRAIGRPVLLSAGLMRMPGVAVAHQSTHGQEGFDRSIGVQ